MYFIYCLTYIHAFTRYMSIATQVLTKLVRPLYMRDIATLTFIGTIAKV